MNRHDRSCSIGNCGGNLGRINVESGFDWFNRNRRRAGIGDGQPGGDVCVRRNNDFVAIANPVRLENEMQRVQAISNADAVTDANAPREIILEPGNLFPENEPAVVKYPLVGCVELPPEFPGLQRAGRERVLSWRAPYRVQILSIIIVIAFRIVPIRGEHEAHRSGREIGDFPPHFRGDEHAA